MKRLNLATTLIAMLLLVSCGQQKRYSDLDRLKPMADIQIADIVKTKEINTLQSSNAQDTIKIEMDGREFLIMRAMKDIDGEMVAYEELEAAVVSARFRNVTERNGKVDISFNITVPPSMQDPGWQVRFYPKLTINDSITQLEGILLTGERYLAKKLRGYQLYSDFINSIIPDDADFEVYFTYKNALETFIKRNIPQLWEFRQDTTFYNPADFQTYYGMPFKEVLDHFTRHLRIKRNEYRKSRIDEMYRRYVAPYKTEPIKLDSVINETDGSKTYKYTHTIRTRKGMSKAYLNLRGEIWEGNRKIYDMPQGEPLVYYISTLNFFADTSTRYMMEVIHRNLAQKITADIRFKVGKSEISEELADNQRQIGMVKEMIQEILSSNLYEVDSITIKAGCSPEGSVKLNDKLARERAQSIKKYFENYTKGLTVEYFATMDSAGKFSYNKNDLSFIAKSQGENWDLMKQLVKDDTYLNDNEKDMILSLFQTCDLDSRELELRKSRNYDYLSETIYPLLRKVEFDFWLSRKGMIQDTIHSTVPDATYMEGVAALMDFDYKNAVRLLGPYRDMNAALSYLNSNYENTAIAILSELPITAKQQYLLAICHARKDEEPEAVRFLTSAVMMDNSLFFRMNLDPEVSYIAKKYNIEQSLYE